MAAYIITDKNNLVAIADAIRAQTGSAEPMTLGAMQAAVTGGGVNADNIVLGLGEDGLVYAFVDGQPVSTGVKKEDLVIINPGEPDNPNTPDDPEIPEGTFALPAGIYTSGTLSEFTRGNISAEEAQANFIFTFEKALESNVFAIEGSTIQITGGTHDGYDGDLVIPDGAGYTGVNVNDPFGDMSSPCFNERGIYMPEGCTFLEGDWMKPSFVIIPKSLTYIGASSGFSSGEPMAVFYRGSEDDWSNVTVDFSDANMLVEQYNFNPYEI